MSVFRPVQTLGTALLFLSIISPISILSASPAPRAIAVTNLKAVQGCDTASAESVSSRLYEELTGYSKATVMDRSEMNRILDSLNDTCSTTQCLLRKGSILKADAITHGSLGRMGSTWWLDIRVLNLHDGTTIDRVSLDVKGSLNDLLQKTPELANRIANAVSNGSAVRTTRAPINPVSDTRPKPIADPQNKNRTGLGAAYIFYPAPPDRDSAGGPYYKMWDSGTVSRVEATVYIAAGPFLNITITPACTYLQSVQKNVRENGITMISVSPGVMFVKRWYPLKLNIGASIDMNWMFYNEKNFMTNGTETNYSMQGLSPGAAANIGGEFLITPNIGVGADVIFRYTELNVSDWNLLFGHDAFNIRMPWLGFRFGASVYF